MPSDYSPSKSLSPKKLEKMPQIAGRKSSGEQMPDHMMRLRQAVSEFTENVGNLGRDPSSSPSKQLRNSNFTSSSPPTSQSPDRRRGAKAEDKDKLLRSSLASMPESIASSAKFAGPPPPRVSSASACSTMTAPERHEGNAANVITYPNSRTVARCTSTEELIGSNFDGNLVSPSPPRPSSSSSSAGGGLAGLMQRRSGAAPPGTSSYNYSTGISGIAGLEGDELRFSVSTVGNDDFSNSSLKNPLEEVSNIPSKLDFGSSTASSQMLRPMRVNNTTTSNPSSVTSSMQNVQIPDDLRLSAEEKNEAVMAATMRLTKQRLDLLPNNSPGATISNSGARTPGANSAGVAMPKLPLPFRAKESDFVGDKYRKTNGEDWSPNTGGSQSSHNLAPGNDVEEGTPPLLHTLSQEGATSNAGGGPGPVIPLSTGAGAPASGAASATTPFQDVEVVDQDEPLLGGTNAIFQPRGPPGGSALYPQPAEPIQIQQQLQQSNTAHLLIKKQKVPEEASTTIPSTSDEQAGTSASDHNIAVPAAVITEAGVVRVQPLSATTSVETPMQQEQNNSHNSQQAGAAQQHFYIGTPDAANASVVSSTAANESFCPGNSVVVNIPPQDVEILVDQRSNGNSSNLMSSQRTSGASSSNAASPEIVFNAVPPPPPKRAAAGAQGNYASGLNNSQQNSINNYVLSHSQENFLNTSNASSAPSRSSFHRGNTNNNLNTSGGHNLNRSRNSNYAIPMSSDRSHNELLSNTSAFHNNSAYGSSRGHGPGMNSLMGGITQLFDEEVNGNFIPDQSLDDYEAEAQDISDFLEQAGESPVDKRTRVAMLNRGKLQHKPVLFEDQNQNGFRSEQHQDHEQLSGNFILGDATANNSTLPSSIQLKFDQSSVSQNDILLQQQQQQQNTTSSILSSQSSYEQQQLQQQHPVSQSLASSTDLYFSAGALAPGSGGKSVYPRELYKDTRRIGGQTGDYPAAVVVDQDNNLQDDQFASTIKGENSPGNSDFEPSILADVTPRTPAEDRGALQGSGRGMIGSSSRGHNTSSSSAAAQSRQASGTLRIQIHDGHGSSGGTLSASPDSLQGSTTSGAAAAASNNYRLASVRSTESTPPVRAPEQKPLNRSGVMVPKLILPSSNDISGEEESSQNVSNFQQDGTGDYSQQQQQLPASVDGDENNPNNRSQLSAGGASSINSQNEIHRFMKNCSNGNIMEELQPGSNSHAQQMQRQQQQQNPPGAAASASTGSSMQIPFLRSRQHNDPQQFFNNNNGEETAPSRTRFTRSNHQTPSLLIGASATHSHLNSMNLNNGRIHHNQDTLLLNSPFDRDLERASRLRQLSGGQLSGNSSVMGSRNRTPTSSSSVNESGKQKYHWRVRQKLLELKACAGVQSSLMNNGQGNPMVDNDAPFLAGQEEEEVHIADVSTPSTENGAMPPRRARGAHVRDNMGRTGSQGSSGRLGPSASASQADGTDPLDIAVLEKENNVLAEELVRMQLYSENEKYELHEEIRAAKMEIQRERRNRMRIESKLAVQSKYSEKMVSDNIELQTELSETCRKFFSSAASSVAGSRSVGGNGGGGLSQHDLSSIATVGGLTSGRNSRASSVGRFAEFVSSRPARAQERSAPPGGVRLSSWLPGEHQHAPYSFQQGSTRGGSAQRDTTSYLPRPVQHSHSAPAAPSQLAHPTQVQHSAFAYQQPVSQSQPSSAAFPQQQQAAPQPVIQVSVSQPQPYPSAYNHHSMPPQQVLSGGGPHFTRQGTAAPSVPQFTTAPQQQQFQPHHPVQFAIPQQTQPQFAVQPAPQWTAAAPPSNPHAGVVQHASYNDGVQQLPPAHQAQQNFHSTTSSYQSPFPQPGPSVLKNSNDQTPQLPFYADSSAQQSVTSSVISRGFNQLRRQSVQSAAGNNMDTTLESRMRMAAEQRRKMQEKAFLKVNGLAN
ncbi:unnamed protein product [Amoebophrya sp. A120]|nr:unnamed protein product [Amoebophrya sp. A120]|eukprot:GSA120T00018759001.1